MKAVICERACCERVAPVIEIAHDQRGQVSRLAEQMVFHEMKHLPVPLAFGKAEMPVNQMECSFRTVDDHQLRLGASAASF